MIHKAAAVITATAAFVATAVALFAAFAQSARADIPVRWETDAYRVKPLIYECYHGETLDMAATLTAYGDPLDLRGKTARLWWQTNGMDAAWWHTNAEVRVDAATGATNILAATWYGACDTGADEVRGFIGVEGENYRAAFTLRFRHSPGFAPALLPLPARTIDWGAVANERAELAPFALKGSGGSFVTAPEATNISAGVVARDVAPWAMAGQARPVADLTAATNYTDAATNALANKVAIEIIAATNGMSAAYITDGTNKVHANLEIERAYVRSAWVPSQTITNNAVYFSEPHYFGGVWRCWVNEYVGSAWRHTERVVMYDANGDVETNPEAAELWFFDKTTKTILVTERGWEHVDMVATTSAVVSATSVLDAKVNAASSAATNYTDAATNALAAEVRVKADLNVYGDGWNLSAFTAVDGGLWYRVCTVPDEGDFVVASGPTNAPSAVAALLGVMPPDGKQAPPFHYKVGEVFDARYASLVGLEFYAVTNGTAGDGLVRLSQFPQIPTVHPWATNAAPPYSNQIMMDVDHPNDTVYSTVFNLGQALWGVSSAVDGKLSATNEAGTQSVYWDGDILTFTYGISVEQSPVSFASADGTYFADVSLQEMLDAKADPADITAATNGLYSAASGNALAAQVATIGAHLNAEDAQFIVTNYNSVTHMPEAYFKIKLPDQSWTVIWNEMTRFNWLTNSFLPNSYASKTELNEKADRAWGYYDSHSGLYAPDGYTWISSPKIAIAADLAYQRTITSAGNVWVLCSQGMVTETGGDTNGYFRISDNKGHTAFEIVAGEERLIGAPVTNVTTAANTIIITYPVNARPTIEVCDSLTNHLWKVETDNDCIATVTWSGQAGAWVATVEAKQTPQPQMFVQATYKTGGETIVRNTAPVSLTHVYIGGTKYAVGTATISGHTVMTLTPAN